jgi:hypothetical protein
MRDTLPEPLPIDYDIMDTPHDSFPDDLFMGMPPEPDDFGYDPSFASDPFPPEPDGWIPPDNGLLLHDQQIANDLSPAHQDGIEGFEQPLSEVTPIDEGWSWYEAKLIGVERESDEGVQYEIGCMDMYTNVNTGDLRANYLLIASFNDVDVATTFYHNLEEQTHNAEIPVTNLPAFAEGVAREMKGDAEGWRGAQREEYAAYEAMHSVHSYRLDYIDEPPLEAIDPLIETAVQLSGVPIEHDAERTAFQALSSVAALAAIGVEAEGFDPSKDPPPFYDEATGTAYWIGVFQPDRDDRENCVTSILSLGRNLETGEMEARLAPCAPGNWDKAYTAAEYLIEVAQKGGIDRCFDAAEGMALATDQRELWDEERGIALEREAADEIADYTRESWEVAL